MKGKVFSQDDVRHIAKLANIPVTTQEEEKLAGEFTVTMKVVDQLFSVNVKSVKPTHQVSGLENVLREDDVDTVRQFTQDQALMNASQTHNGYFVVPQIIEEK
jgi:aspartyl/glutamyl-tRNA(Asn/Gln) amidotransferase C subunit